MRTLGMLFFAFSSGLAVAAGTFAFLAAIGLIPRLAKRTRTQRYLRIYENATVLGGIFGTTTLFLHYHLPPSRLLLLAFALLQGLFVGVLVMALTEVLNVMPILMRRVRLTQGLSWLILAFALGKVLGSLLYYLVDGFYVF